jgi:proline iminopeptidase
MIFMISTAAAGRYHRPVPAVALYPDAPLLRRHALAVGDGHVLDLAEYGCADGVPALVLHGGPGSGCSPLLRRFFDPQRFRIVCVDQRGAGLSTPRGGTTHNTTTHLLEDLRRVRRHLGVARWLVVGGSWGAALGIAHAADDPDAVAALLLRSSFLARAEDIAWFFQGAADTAPAAWQHFAAAAPPADRTALLPWLARTLREGDAGARRSAALAWWQWEQALAGTHNDAPAGAALDALIDPLVDRYRVQSHYLLQNAFLTDPPLLQRCARAPEVPTLLLHGRVDRVCRPEGARALRRALPHAALQWIDGAGHDPAHPAMVTAMVNALDAYAERGAFDAAVPAR